MLLRVKFLVGLTLAFLVMALIVSLEANAQHGIDLKGGSSPGLITSVPRTMTYQGILKDGDGNPIPNESKDIIFRIYDDATVGELEWNETIQITTDDGGYFTATLSNLEIPFDEDYWLELEVDSEILSPRQKLNMVAYAAVSDTADYARTAAGGGWVDDGPSVRLETSSDYVGIGTASPTNKVHVFGSDSAPLLNVEKIGPGRGVRVSTSSACALWVENSGNHGLRVTNANGDGIHVTQAGGWAGYFNGTGYFNDNVGIGTTSPAEKLDVVGNIHASGTISSGNSITIDGANDKITASSGTIDFDDENLVTTGKATIGPGHTNAGVYAFIAGLDNATGGNYSTVGGGWDNAASADGSTVGGGVSDTASGTFSTVGGGGLNVASGQHSTVAGGNVNLASGLFSTVSGGVNNTASGYRSCVGGGVHNIASGDNATVGGGFLNRARGLYSVVSGGGGPIPSDSNAAIGNWSAVPGGNRNIAGGDYSFAAGRRAKANHNGAFVWADQTNADFASTGADQFLIRASGGVGIGTTTPGYKLDVHGTVGIDIGSYFNDVPLTINVPSNQAGLISRIAKGGSIINVVDKDGHVGIGTFSPQGALDVNSTTGAFIVPRMTTGQRNALSAVNGMIIYNTTTNQFNFYENGAWVTK